MSSEPSLSDETSPSKQPSQIELRLTPDVRFLPGILGAVAHFADRVGLELAAQAELASAATRAFQAALPLLGEQNPLLIVRVEGFPDQVAVVFEHRGRPWTSADEKMFSNVNRVIRESAGNLSRLVLIQFVAASARG